MLEFVAVGADVVVPAVPNMPEGLDSVSFVALFPKRVVGAVGFAPNRPGPGVDPALAVENSPPELCGVGVFLSVGWGVDAIENRDAMGLAASPIGIAGLSPVGAAASGKAGPPKVKPELDDAEGAVGSLLNGLKSGVALPLPDMAPLVGVDAELLPPPKGRPGDVPLPNIPVAVPTVDGVIDVPAADAPKVLPKGLGVGAVPKNPPLGAPDVVFPPEPTGPDPNKPPS